MEEYEKDGERRILLSPEEGDAFINILEGRLTDSRRQIVARLITMGIITVPMIYLVGLLFKGEGNTGFLVPLGVFVFWMVAFTVKIVRLTLESSKARRVRDRLLIQLGKFEIGRAFQGEEE